MTFKDLLKTKADADVAKASSASIVLSASAALTAAQETDAHSDLDETSADAAIAAALVAGDRFTIDAAGAVTVWKSSASPPGYTTYQPTPDTDPV